MDKVKKLASIFFPISIMFVIITSILYYNKITEVPFLFGFNFIQMLLWGHFYRLVILEKNIFRKELITTELQKNIIKEKLNNKSQLEILKNYDDFIKNLKQQNVSTQFDENVLNQFSKYIEIIVGVVYKKIGENNFEPIASYALPEEIIPQKFKLDDGFCGQAVSDEKVLIIPEIPENYFSTYSGLGNGIPKNLVFIPIIENGKVETLVEIGLFKIKNQYKDFFEKISKNFLTDIKI